MTPTSRALLRSPGFTTTAILALAVGIGANTAVFSIVYAIVLRPLPFADPASLVRIFETNHAQGLERADVSAGTFEQIRARASTLDSVALFTDRQWLLSFGSGSGQDIESVRGAIVSPSVFPMLGVAPILGRTFRAESEQPPPFGDVDETIISHALWQRRFGGRPDVIGRTLQLEGRRPSTIVGVMPAGFDFPAQTEYWRNLVFRRVIGPDERATRYLQCIARLKPGVAVEDARAELGAIAAQLAIQYPASNAGYGVRIDRLDEVVTGGIAPALLMILGAVGCVLLIACANVANLMLARATTQKREIAIRAALGATRLRLLRERLLECAMLAGAGAIGGLVLGYWGLRMLVALAPVNTPRLPEVTFGMPALAAAAVLAIVATCVTGAIPVLGRRHEALSAALDSGGRGAAPIGRGARSWLIGSQVALTLTLLTVAALLFRSFVALHQVDLGFHPARLLTADLLLSTGRFADIKQPWFRLWRHYDDVMRSLAALPGVDSAGGVTDVPLAHGAPTGKFWIDRGVGVRPDATQQFDVAITIVTPGYFDTMGMRMRRGRAFVATDALTEDALTHPGRTPKDRPLGVVVINEAMARRYWPNADPIGRSIVLADHWAVRSSTVVGVVSDVRSARVEAPAEPTVYAPFGEIAGFRMSVAIRSRADLASLASAVRGTLRGVDPQMVVMNVQSMDAVFATAVAKPRFTLAIAASFALVALTLATVGIAGMAAYLVSRRTREIGIRMALGASVRDVIMLMLRQGLTPVALGLLGGVIAALLASRAVSALLFGVGPFDPWSLMVSAAMLGGAAVVAVLVPAARAARIDPLRALRHEQ